MDLKIDFFAFFPVTKKNPKLQEYSSHELQVCQVSEELKFLRSQNVMQNVDQKSARLTLQVYSVVPTCTTTLLESTPYGVASLPPSVDDKLTGVDPYGGST